MKPFAKLSLLLALIVAGRFVRSTAPPVPSTTAVTSPIVGEPDALRLTFSAGKPASESVPVSQRSNSQPAPSDSEPVVWF